MFYKITLAILAISPSLTFALNGDRGSLEVTSNPEKALVYLDGNNVPEPISTPFVNNAMIPGTHTLCVSPPSNLYKPTCFEIQIASGESVKIHHNFDFRTQAFHATHLSVSPWTFRIESGYAYHRYLGMLGADNYDPDSIPTSSLFPTSFRLGLPHGLEFSLHIPFGWQTDANGKSSDVNFGDAQTSIKYTHEPIRSAMALGWTLPSGSNHMGENRHQLHVELATSQSFNIAEVLANLSYHIHFADQDSSRLKYGDHLKAFIRPGVFLGGFLLPYFGVRGETWFADYYGKESLHNNGYILSFEPGIIADIGKNANIELAIPIFLIGDKAQKGWGIHLGFSYGFGFSSKEPVHNQQNGLSTAHTPSLSGHTPYTPILFDSHEVTNAEYRKFCELHSRPLPSDPQFPDMPDYINNPLFNDYPVVNVSLDDAKAYARWKGKRLPTVAEWKNAVASFSGDLQSSCGHHQPMQAISGALQNGFYHLIGNVAEWVIGEDAVSGTAYTAGGFYSLPLERCQNTNQLIDVSSTSGSPLIGFRLVSDVQ